MALLNKAARLAKRATQWVKNLVKAALRPRAPPTYTVPHDVVLHIAGILKARQRYRSLARLRATSRGMYEALTPILLGGINDPRAAQNIFKMLDKVTVVQAYKSLARTANPRIHDLTGPTVAVQLIDDSKVLAYRGVAKSIKKMTLDLPAFEALCRIFERNKTFVARVLYSNSDLLTALSHLTIRYNETDLGRLISPHPVLEGRRREAFWNVRTRGFQSARDGKNSVPITTQRWVASFLKSQKLCIIPVPALYDRPPTQPQGLSLDPRWREIALERQTTFCSFPSDFATVHNVHRYPCILPNAKVIRIVFLPDIDPMPGFESMPDYHGIPTQRAVLLKRYDERLALVRAMVRQLGPDVRKVVLVELERAVDPKARGDLTKNQFYSKIRKVFRRARQGVRVKPDGTYGPRGQKLKYVLFDGEGGNGKKCGDCGSEWYLLHPPTLRC